MFILFFLITIFVPLIIASVIVYVFNKPVKSRAALELQKPKGHLLSFLFGKPAKEIPNAYDMKIATVDAACQEKDTPSLSFWQRFSLNLKLRRIVAEINAYIRVLAESELTEYHLAIVDSSDKENKYEIAEEIYSEGIIYMSSVYKTHTIAYLRKIYEKNGYDVSFNVASTFRGTIYIRGVISWSKGIEKQYLTQVKYKEQVQSFREGVPLEDIV